MIFITIELRLDILPPVACDEAVTFIPYTFAITQIPYTVKVTKQPMARSGEDLKMAKPSLISLNRGSFDVIVGMDWLSKRKFGVVCYEKVVRILVDALSIKERVKSRRVRGMILAAQSEVLKQENVLAERLHGLDPQMERKRDESMYFMDRIWVLLVGSVMDEAHASRYLVHPGADKMYYNLGDMYW
ncbi:hypothetical protein Tco_1152864 [Tanacetum coccineum]